MVEQQSSKMLILCGGVVIATVLFLGCGGPPPDSPTVGQSAGASGEVPSSLVASLAGVDAPAAIHPSLPQSANLEPRAPQSASTAAGPLSAEYGHATSAPQQAGPQAGAIPIDDPPEELRPLANLVIDHAEEMHAHDLWLDQVLQEVE